MTSRPAAVLDTNVVVAAGFRPGSASGRLVEAVREGRLLAFWTDATRREAERVVGRIPPLRGLDVEALFQSAARRDEPGQGGLEATPAGLARALAALARAEGAPLVTADAALADGASSHGVEALSPAAAARRLLGG